MRRYEFLRVASRVIMTFGGVIIAAAFALAIVWLPGFGQPKEFLGFPGYVGLFFGLLGVLYGLLIASIGQLIRVFVEMSDSIQKIEQNSEELVQSARPKEPIKLRAA